MDHDALIDTLRACFGSEFIAEEAEGRHQMATHLAATAGVPLAQGRAWLDALIAADRLDYAPGELPNPAAMLEASRYGDSPPTESQSGRWRIGL